jgi:hypothetical protein
MRRPPAKIISRPNALAKKVGRFTLDPQRLERAQAVVAAHAQDYVARLLEEAHALAAGWQEAAAEDREAIVRLHRIAHDIKGQGTTFGYPLATEVAAALCRLLMGGGLARAKAREVVEAHIAALAAIAGGPIAGDGGEAGAALLEGLRRTREKLGLDA